MPPRPGAGLSHHLFIKPCTLRMNCYIDLHERRAGLLPDYRTTKGFADSGLKVHAVCHPTHLNRLVYQGWRRV